MQVADAQFGQRRHLAETAAVLADTHAALARVDRPTKSAERFEVCHSPAFAHLKNQAPCYGAVRIQLGHGRFHKTLAGDRSGAQRHHQRRPFQVGGKRLERDLQGRQIQLRAAQQALRHRHELPCIQPGRMPGPVPTRRGQHQRGLLHQELAVQAVDRTECQPQAVLGNRLLDVRLPLRGGARQVDMPGVFCLPHAIDQIGFCGCQRHINPGQHRIQSFARLKPAPAQPRGVVGSRPMLFAHRLQRTQALLCLRLRQHMGRQQEREIRAVEPAADGLLEPLFDAVDCTADCLQVTVGGFSPQQAVHCGQIRQPDDDDEPCAAARRIQGLVKYL